MPRAQREVRAAQAAGERLTQMRARRRVRPGGRRGSAGPRHRTPPPSPGSVLLPPQPLVVGGRAALPAHQAARRYLAPVTYIKQPAVEPQLRTAAPAPRRISAWEPVASGPGGPHEDLDEGNVGERAVSESPRTQLTDVGGGVGGVEQRSPS